MKFLIIGHPRTGTGYAAKLLQSAGYDVGHEKMGDNGISSWFWPTKDTDPPYGATPYTPDFKPDVTIHIVRHPKDAIASVQYTETTTELYRAYYTSIPSNLPTARAMESLAGWHQLCQSFRPDYMVKTEHLDKFLLRRRWIAPVGIPKTVNSRPHPKIPERVLQHDPQYRILLDQWEDAYG